MKKRMKKVLIACSAIMCVLILNVLSVFAVEDGTVTDVTSGGIAQYFADISSYRDDTFTVEREGENGNPETITYYNNELSAPTGYEDYIFAGWYTTAECTTTLGSDVTSDSAYAKFVPKQILGIKAQIEAGTQGGSDSSSIRFVTTVDSLKYQTVGFDFEINEKKLNAESDSVYKRLEAKGADDRVLNYTPAKLFHTMSKYFMACTVTDVPNADFGHGIFVTPYWITNDGTKVYSDQDMRTINMGYMPYATNVTASLVTSDSGIPGPSGSTSAQGGCTDGTYYYQVTLKNSTASGADPDADNVYIQRFELSNGKWVAGSQSSIMPLQHGNDLTYNKNLTYDGQTGRSQGLIVVCQNNPNAKRVSFVDPDTLTIVNPNNIKDATSGVAKEWASDTITDTYVEISKMIFGIDYNAARDQYVVGISGGKTFCILDSNLKVISDIYQPTDKTNGFGNQGVGSDDGYIYFVFYHAPNKVIEGYNTHVIAVYDWEGNAVTVMNISSDSIPVYSSGVTCEPETISIYDNTFYIPCIRWETTNFDGTFIYKVDNMNIDYSGSVAEIVRNDKTMGYFTLEDAMADAQQGETINLLADVTVDSTMEMLAKNVTITTDVAEGVTVTRGAAVTMIDVAEGGSLKIDGKVTIDGNGENVSGGSSHLVDNAGIFTLGAETVIQNVKSTTGSAIINQATGTLNLSGTLSGNTSTSSGAAVKVSGGTLTVNGARFTGNVGTYGAAIYSNKETAEIKIENATFENNIAQATSATNGYGGAISLTNISEAEITASQFTGNHSSYTGTSDLGGGAIYILTSSLTLTDCQFENNTATKDGGAIHSRNSVLTATECTFIDNSAENGNGEIYNKTNTVSLESCTFENDTVVNNGGKIIVSGDMQMSGEGFVVATKTTASAAREVEIGEDGLTGKIIITPKSYDTNDKYAVGGAIANYATMVDVTPNGGYPYDVTAEGKLKLQAPYDTAEAAIGEQAYDTLSAAINAANADSTATLDNPVTITVLKQDIEVSSTLGVTGYVKLTTIKDNDVTIKRTMADNLFLIATSDSPGKGSLEIDGVITLDGNKEKLGTDDKIYFIRCYGELFTLGSKAIIQNHSGNSWGGAVRGQTGTINLYGTLKDNESIGKGAAVRAEECILNVSGAKFINNAGKYGGAIYAITSTVYIDGATFTESSASAGGGALYFDSNVTATIKDTMFDTNHSKGSTYNGGAIMQGATGTTTTMTGCTFQGNTTENLGESVYNSGSMNVSDCTFVDQTFVNNGTKGKTEITGLLTGVQFVNNTDSVTTVIIGKDGLDRRSSMTIKPKSYTADRILLSAQETETEEQAVKNLANAANMIDIVQPKDAYWYINDEGKLTQATIAVGTFDALKAAIPTEGSATIYITEDIEMTEALTIPQGVDVTIKGKNGVRLYRSSSIKMFTIGDATNGGGSLNIDGTIILDGNKDVVPKTTSDAKNLIESYGTFTLGRNAIIKDVKCTIGKRRAIYGWDTSVINLYGTISGCTSNGDGAAIKMSEAGGTLNVDGAIFENNSSDSYGAAISLNASGITATIKNTTFKNNTSKATGGAAIYSKSDLTVNGGTFENNSSVGGAIYLDSNVTATIENATFSNNTDSSSGGGAIYSKGKSLTLNGNTFTANESSNVGGAIRVAAGTLTVDGGSFVKNVSTQGGAIFVKGATAEIKNATFSSNESTKAGGGAVYSEGELTLNDNTFANNIAGTFGGAVHCQKANLSVTGCSFEMNQAGTYGGAIRANGASGANVTVIITGGTFHANEAISYHGGALSVNYVESLTVDGTSSFTENKASKGTAIHIGSTLVSKTIDENCTFDEGQTTYSEAETSN